MNLDRLRWGEWIAGISALVLLLVTFRAWYKVAGDGRVTAWDALEQGRYLLIVTAIAGIFLWLVKAAEETKFPMGWITAGIGLICTVYIAYRLASPPSDNLDADIGLFFGLAAAFGVTVGGLISAREPEPAFSGSPPATQAGPGDGGFGAPEPGGAEAPSETWSPAAPVASSAGWSPAAPAAPVAPATPAGALGGTGREVRAGDSVVLTAGGARFPAGTVAEVVEVFAGGALVEVRAPDGMAERFEVPDSAYEPAAGAGAAAAAGENWSPAMPAPASEDWGFDEPAAGAAEGTATETAPAAAEAKPAKVPWWKREIGGGKKKKDDDDTAAELGAAGAVAAGAAALEAESNGSGGEKPGFFKRVFGGGGAKDEPATETLEAESTPATDVGGLGQAAESDTAVDEPVAQAATEAPPAPPEPEPVAAEPEPAAPAPEPVVEPEPEPEAAAPEPVVEPTPEPEPEPAPSAPEPVVEPEPEAAAPEPVVEPTPEPVVEPTPEPEPEAAAPEPTPEPDPPAAEAAGAGAAAAAAASAEPAADEEVAPKPKRKRSSGSRKVPKEALAAVDEGQPKVGDEVQLKVGGGRYDAGTKGTVVDVFSAGVIVELSDEDGRTERLDLPFEAIGPADA